MKPRKSGLDVIDTASILMGTTILAGHPISGVIAVTVQGPSAEDQIATLTDDVAALITGGSLNKGQGNALTKKLDGILTQLAKGKVVVAMNRLMAFIHQTQALIDDGVLTAAEGQPLIDAGARSRLTASPYCWPAVILTAFCSSTISATSAITALAS